MDQQNLEQRLRELEEKWFNKTITDEEAGEYAAWYNNDQDKPVDIPSSFAVSEVEHRDRLLQNIRQSSGIETPVLTLQARKNRTKWVAAAVVFVLMGATMYNWFLKEKSSTESNIPTPETISAKDDVLPGSDKAILILDNGETIVLDSAANGMLAQQGNARIVKKADGELDYQVDTEIPSEPVFHTMRTPRGGEYHVTLPDGSRIWLNAASSIRYPTAFNGNERSVTITGEVYFEVAKDKSKPFKVNIDGKGEVEVLGTHFNINAYNDEPSINTTLLEGAVKISNGHQRLLMQPGQQALFQPDKKINIRQAADIEEIMAWKNGYFIFRNATTETIMRQVKRWYDAEIIFEGDTRNERFAGNVPRSANASKLLEALELTKTVKFEIKNKKIIVKPYH